MKKRNIIFISFILLMALVSLTILVGCKNKDNKNNDVNSIVTQIMSEAEPNTSVVIGEFDSILSDSCSDTDDTIKDYSSNTILDAPKDFMTNIVVNDDLDRPLKSIPSLLSNIASANDSLNIITITDRSGNKPNVSLTSNDTILKTTKEGEFEYGEVYQITINDAPYLCFENKDPQFRTLTVEIEDDPAWAKTYDIKEKKSGIIDIDRQYVINKKISDEELSFDYIKQQDLDLKSGDVFYVSIPGAPNASLDFYGVAVDIKKSGQKLTVKYKAPSITDIYSNFHIKGASPFNLDNSQVLLTEKIALEQFRTSSLATSLGMTLINDLNFTPADVMNIMKAVNFSVNINFVGNTLDFKVVLKLGNFKIDDGIYFSFEFAYEKYTEYNLDFDVSIRTEWIIPCGVDYKVKMVEDSQTVFYFKVTFDSRILDEIPNDVDYTKELLDEFDKCVNGDTDSFSYLTDEDVTPQTSGTKTVWPLLEVNSYYFSPLQVKFKIDFYLDLGVQVKGIFKKEVHSRKVDFNFTNMNGAEQSDSTEIKGTSNLTVVAGGSIHAEIGLRTSLGLSFLGLYDYIHGEAYVEAYINVTFQGLLAIDWDFTDSEFTGFVCADFNVTMGIRAGFNFKAFIFDYNVSRTWASSVFRIKLDNALEHWSHDAEAIIELDKTQSIDIDDTQCLRLEYFDSLAFSVKEKKYKSDDEIAIVSGWLCPDSLIKATSKRIFNYTVDDPSLIKMSNDGVINVLDGTPNEFTTTIVVDVLDLAGNASDRTITIHFIAGDTKEVYAGDDLIGEYRPSASFTLPEAKVIRGKEFDHYSYNGVDYKPGDTFLMPASIDERIVLELYYNDLPLFRVYFYDGYNKLVAFDEVYMYEDATPPYEALRDCHMDEGFVFVSWDKDITNIVHEMHVYAIYMKVE